MNNESELPVGGQNQQDVDGHYAQYYQPTRQEARDPVVQARNLIFPKPDPRSRNFTFPEYALRETNECLMIARGLEARENDPVKRAAMKSQNDALAAIVDAYDKVFENLVSRALNEYADHVNCYEVQRLESEQN